MKEDKLQPKKSIAKLHTFVHQALEKEIEKPI